LERLFGTDGVRGVANEYPMTPQIAMAIGRAGAQVLKAKARSIVIGKDTRTSCDMLEAALIAGITSAGCDALRAGILPTPGIAYLTKRLSAATGIVISASHNPAQENGIKFFGPDGFKLPDEVEEKIEGLIFARDEDLPHPTGSGIGRVHEIGDAQGQYVNFLKGIVLGLDLAGMKLVLDCANGATYEVGPELFRELGAEVVELSSKPDGGNINLDCGSLHPESLAKAVIEKKADLGLAFDGDGDRLIPCDESGRILDGDFTMAILAKFLKEEKKLANNCVVCTQMSNLGLDLALEGLGIESVRTKVGDRYVNEEMRRRGAVLGGEESGHIIFPDCHTTGDGIITALQLLRVMRETGEPLSKLAEVMHKFPQITVNVKVKNKPDLESIPEVQRAIADAKRELARRGRVLVRYSGTQPLCRVMVEGPTQDDVGRIANTIARLVEEKLG